jgi:hypothetical protein
MPAYSCNASYCQATAKAGAVYYPASGGSQGLAAGAVLHITCYYGDSASPDGYADHVISINGNSRDGHVYDTYVDFGGLYPWEVGLPVC